MINNEIVVSKNNEGRRIDSFLFKVFSPLPKSLILSFIRKRKIRINGKRITKRNYVLKENDIIKYYFFPEQIKKEKVFVKTHLDNKNIFFEDKKILVVYKEPGIVMHSHPTSLNNMVYYYLFNKKEKVYDQAFQIHHVNRLDKFAQGLVVYAKNREVQNFLYKEFLNKRVKKGYYCVIRKNNDFLLNKEVTLKGYIQYKNGRFWKLLKNQDNEKSKYAEISVTNVEIINKDLVLLKVLSKTGRKHQIRILLSENKAPILNDNKYPTEDNNQTKPLLLFAYYLSFNDQIEKRVLNKYIFEVKKELIINRIQEILSNTNNGLLQ